MALRRDLSRSGPSRSRAARESGLHQGSQGLRGEANFPTPGTGQVDHDLLFRTLAGAGFRGPVAVQRVDGTESAEKMPAELIDERIAAARRFLSPILEKYSRG